MTVGCVRNGLCPETGAAESTPCTSKFESDLPGSEDSNFDVLQVDCSQCPREAHGGQETVQPMQRRLFSAGTASV
jgi:hypothetical protein